MNMMNAHHQQQQQHLYSQALQMPGVHMNRQQPQQMQNQTVYGSPQRRFLSEGELVRQGTELSYARSNNTVDNIRELAGSPQKGVYMWKDNSPGYNGNQPSSQFPVAQNQPNNMQMHHEYINRGQPQQSLPPPHHQQMQMQQQQHLPNNVHAQHDYNSRHRSNPTSPTQQYGNNGANTSNNSNIYSSNSASRYNQVN